MVLAALVSDVAVRLRQQFSEFEKRFLWKNHFDFLVGLHGFVRPFTLYAD
jgi:hypothetical protein